MGEAIGQLLPFAFGVAISPMPIVAVVLLLATPRAKVNGLAFLFGWLLGLAGVGAILLAIAGPANASDDGGPATWVNWLKLVLGVALLLLAVKQWRGRPRAGQQAPTPKWMRALDALTPIKTVGLGVVLGAINPKCLLFIVGAAAVVAQTGIPAGDQAVAWAVFTVLATIGVAAPLVIYFVMGERAAELLDELKTWLIHNNTAILAGIVLILGVKLIGDAISGFSA